MWKLREVAAEEVECLDAVYRLRLAAWLPKDPRLAELLPDGRWTDDHDAHALHWIAERDGQLVGAARLCLHERALDVPQGQIFLPEGGAMSGPFGSFNRLVVSESARGHGIARALDEVRVSEARRRGVKTGLAATFSGPGRLAALVKQGWQVLPGERAGNWFNGKVPGLTWALVLPLGG